MSKKQTAPAIPAAAFAAGLVYVGQHGDHINGIPARSLTPAEVELLTAEQVDACLKSKLYEVNNES